MEAGAWNNEIYFLELAGIQHFLDAPYVAKFYGWKEEAVKFSVIQYHNGNLWSKVLVEITRGMTHRITRIPHGVNPILKTLNSNAWIQFLIRGTSKKNSKGLLINKVTDLMEK
jgi:hypothetical protein